MKKIYFILFAILVSTGCDDNFLEKLPKDALVEETTFVNYENFKTYAWGFYETFPAYNLSVPNSEFHGDLFSNSFAFDNSGASAWIWGRINVPTNSDEWTIPYQQIRRANIMLGNLESSQLTENDQAHWRSVGLFFRSWSYFNLLIKYGDVPWVEETLTEADPRLYAARDTRDQVAANILRDLTYAEENIREEGDGKNTINVHVVRALISRFGLFEGTWRKYHELGGETEFLRASADASLELINTFSTLHPNYDEVFNSASLDGVNGILLYKQYEEGALTQILTSRHRNSAGNWDLTKKAADMFLYTDGTPVSANPAFAGGSGLESDPYSEFRDRDRRMYFITVPPFKVNTPGNQNVKEWSHTGDPADREYIDLMATLSDELHKQLPTSNWGGLIVRETPHWRPFNNGQPYNVTRTGYKLFKYYNALNTGVQNRDFADAPIFRMGEVMMNYAEAKFELSEFDQAVADQTINLLRARGQVAALTVANIDAGFDPVRDPEIDPILWEIRRERAVELMAEGFRFDDLRRWRKMDDYAAKEKLGRYIVASDLNNTVPVQNGAAEGYVSWFGTPPLFPEHYYLYPIPSNQIVLNDNIRQNTNW
ncbi:RagB/SusD family nutrient uptake outer membrane protein [Fulvivirga sp. M361]|uniref:RagB/SusD family nutrient uptake outer membrane protein n=1 Tax=Fulvivirga sp. M361 TaxID=2594266 RepID=UPI00117B5E4A|nr:RagB/SusD family nutrient uptake outer membrane protein [Fulvivirga sp. M361]TRX49689.1 RagB/SusD family nutrient uptake outer membrane protein [Fulvivirga sp. M361]